MQAVLNGRVNNTQGAEYMKQQTFASLDYARKKKQTHERDREMRSTRKGGWSVSLLNRGIILAWRRLLGRM